MEHEAKYWSNRRASEISPASPVAGLRALALSADGAAVAASAAVDSSPFVAEDEKPGVGVDSSAHEGPYPLPNPRYICTR
jgi:hypothetical protein